MKTVIIEYGSGNANSLKNAFSRLGESSIYTSNTKDIEAADRIILPGIGHHGSTMHALKNSRLLDTLNYQVTVLHKPILGICLGMQLMTDYSLEKIKTYGLGWLKGHLKKIDISGNDYLGNKFRLPHMGWNNLQILDNSHPFLKNISDVDQFYFVHSYFLTEGIKHEILANTTYSHELPAIIGNKNFFGVQFHPEKSSFAGQKIISNWLGL